MASVRGMRSCRLWPGEGRAISTVQEINRSGDRVFFEFKLINISPGMERDRKETIGQMEEFNA